MKIEKTERVDTVTITMTREQVYQTQRFLHHNITLERNDHLTTHNLFELRNDWTMIYTKTEDLFGEE